MRAKGFALLICVCLLSACSAASMQQSMQERPAMNGAATQGPDDPPEGWRWESYQDVQLAVPEDWGYGGSTRPWCAPLGAEPVVGRSDYLHGVRCWEDAKGTEVGTGGQFVWFEPTEKTSPQVARISLDDDRSIVRAGSVKVSVQATPQVRHQILDSIQIVDTDHNGCPAVPPFAGRPQWRPQGPELSKIGPPTAISACRYIAARLRSSIRLTGSESAAALAAIKQAPVLGYGPNPPAASCVPDLIPRADQILLRITPKKTIALRYSGCLVPGLDDGTDVHALSRANVQPFLAGPNRVDTSMNPQLAEVLGDNPAR